MTIEIIFQIIFFALALSMDAFAVSVTSGLIYEDINKKRSVLIALTFGIFQALMPLISYWLVEFISFIVGTSAGETAGNILAIAVTWISFSLLLFIGGKMIIDAIIDLRKNKQIECYKCKKFSYKTIFIMGIATSIDALAVGVSLQSGISTNNTIFLHVLIIMSITFILSMIGVNLGHLIEKLFKGRYEICSIIGGSILILLAIWIVSSYYFF